MYYQSSFFLCIKIKYLLCNLIGKPIPGDATPVRMNWQLNRDLIEDKLEAVSQQNLGPGQIATNSGKFGGISHIDKITFSKLFRFIPIVTVLM